MEPRDRLLATVATLYYKKKQSQSAIASQFDMSSSTVSRLLEEALDKGIVQIHIHMPLPRDVELEQALTKQFGLKDAYVLETAGESNEEILLESIGQLAATYVEQLVTGFRPGASLGVAWGTGVQAVVSALPDGFAYGMDVMQLLGGVGALALDSPDLGRMVARKLGGRHYDLHAPVLVEKPEVRELFLQEPTVRESLLRAKAVKLAIMGIGSVQDESSSFLRAGLLSRTDLSHLRKQGVVGEMCGRFFDADGKFDRFTINKRVIGLEFSDLRRIPQSLAIARGTSKAKAILGALRGQLIRVLATDDVTARAVLEGKAVVSSQ